MVTPTGLIKVQRWHVIGLVLTTGAGLIGLGSEERELETKPAKAGVLSEVEDEDEDEDEEALRYL